MHVKNILLRKLRTGQASKAQIKTEQYFGEYFHQYFEKDWAIVIEDYGINRRPIKTPSGWEFSRSGTMMYNYAKEFEDEQKLTAITDDEAFAIFVKWQKKRAKLFADALDKIEKECTYKVEVI